MKSTTPLPRLGAAIGGGLLVGWLLLPAVAPAQWLYATGTTLDVAGVPVTPRDVVTDLSGSVTTRALPDLPATAALAGLADAGGTTLFASTQTVELPGPVFAERRDVVAYSGGAYSLELDGAAAGLPESAAVDGVSRGGSGDLLLSLDTVVDLDGLFVDDADVVAWDGATFSLFFDSSSASVPEGLGVDGVHYEVAGDALLLSFDGAASIDGVTFGREDILRYERVGGTWSLALDATTTEPALATSNLVAVPEPSVWPGLTAGLAALTGLASARSRMSR